MKAKTIVLICLCVGIGVGPTVNGEEDIVQTPYDRNADHLWNRLQRSLFVRHDANGKSYIHSTDPLLYSGGTFLLEGEPHRRAVALLDEFLAAPDDASIRDPLKRLVFQRDLWAAFDYVAWYPDDWVHDTRNEPAAIALRSRLAGAIGRLSLTDREIEALPDNYALAVKSMKFQAEHDPRHPERPFLPADLFDPAGTWVRFHQRTAAPMAQQHFKGAGGRAVHIIFLRLPKGRAATERYLNRLGAESIEQFPVGTMVAMVRRGLVVDRSAKVRVTPITELVQIRVYRRIPADPQANFKGDFGEQDVYEFVLDRGALLAGEHGLRPVGPDEPAVGFLRGDGDPFDEKELRLSNVADRQMESCIRCHQAPGVHSVTSMQQGLREHGDENFATYDWHVEMNYTVRAKVQRFDWGLLQGMLEARRNAARNGDGAAKPIVGYDRD